MSAARTLATLIEDSDREQGSLYPALPRIRDVSAHIAVNVARVAYEAASQQYRRRKICRHTSEAKCTSRSTGATFQHSLSLTISRYLKPPTMCSLAFHRR